MTPDDGRAYARRVRNPDPLRLELARQAVDAMWQAKNPFTFPIAATFAREFGVPLDYVLDEVERRVREGQAP